AEVIAGTKTEVLLAANVGSAGVVTRGGVYTHQAQRARVVSSGDSKVVLDVFAISRGFLGGKLQRSREAAEVGGFVGDRVRPAGVIVEGSPREIAQAVVGHHRGRE